VDLKLTKSDIESQYQTSYEFSDLAAHPATEDAPTLLLGDSVAVSTVAFNKETKRYQLSIRRLQSS